MDVTLDSRPRFSVIIATYNYAHFLSRVLASVFAQTYTRYEVLVIDDGSTDNTIDTLRREYPDIVLFEESQRGVSAARNRGIQASRGDWIAFLDSDDWWTADKLQVCFEVINDKVDLVYHDLEIVSEPTEKEMVVIIYAEAVEALKIGGKTSHYPLYLPDELHSSRPE